MLGDLPQCYGFGVGSKISKFGPDFPFEYCADELNKADILFGNLEVVLSGFDITKDEFAAINLRAQPNTVTGLINAGFDVLSLANNHIMQHGMKALKETLDILTANGIKSTGIKFPDKQITNYCIVERNGISIGFLGYNFRPRQYCFDTPPYVEGKIETIRDDISKLKVKSDIIVVSVHWGDEFIDYPSLEQINLAHRIIDCGADIILGHHPHILQGVEKYKNGVIAYSLGNFIFDMWQKRFRKTMILKLIVSKKGKIDYEIVPVIINSSFQPRIAEGNHSISILEQINSLSQKIYHQLDQDYYNNCLKKEQRRYRSEVYLHYLKHIHRFNPKHLFANFTGAVKRRLKSKQTKESSGN